MVKTERKKYSKSGQPAGQPTASVEKAGSLPDDFVHSLQGWAKELGLSAVGVSNTSLDGAAERLYSWLSEGKHGKMHYMQRHAELRASPAKLHPGTSTVICAALDYRLDSKAHSVLQNQELAYVSRYALGRDYHRIMRKRLQKLATRIANSIKPLGYRVFCDSAPVMEVELACRSGLGWRGKHTLLLTRQGSYRFLGEIYCDLPYADIEGEVSQTGQTEDGQHCGSCRACLDACPTGAIVAPYQLDARLCISYLTIELTGTIPIELRPLIGNRIYGCDDCQLVCPWNRFSRLGDPGFAPRRDLQAPALTALFSWSEKDFNERLLGNPIRRIGYLRWLRNIAVALGNGPASAEAMGALASRQNDASQLLREHVDWAVMRLQEKALSQSNDHTQFGSQANIGEIMLPRYCTKVDNSRSS